MAGDDDQVVRTKEPRPGTVALDCRRRRLYIRCEAPCASTSTQQSYDSLVFARNAGVVVVAAGVGQTLDEFPVNRNALQVGVSAQKLVVVVQQHRRPNDGREADSRNTRLTQNKAH